MNEGDYLMADKKLLIEFLLKRDKEIVELRTKLHKANKEIMKEDTLEAAMEIRGGIHATKYHIEMIEGMDGFNLSFVHVIQDCGCLDYEDLFNYVKRRLLIEKRYELSILENKLEEL